MEGRTRVRLLKCKHRHLYCPFLSVQDQNIYVWKKKEKRVNQNGEKNPFLKEIQRKLGN